jgi:putative endonuclease
MAVHNDVGKKGELEAQRYLIGIGHEVVQVNVRFVYGEIDIVTREKRRSGYAYHFVEVKTVTREKGYSKIEHPLQNVTREKVRRVHMAVQGFLMKHPEIKDWQFDVLCIYLVAGKKTEAELFLNCLL